MSVVNTKSTPITNLDSTPPVMNSRLLDGPVHDLPATVEIAAADCATSVYRMVRVHSSWRLVDIIRYNDAITSGTDFDVGLYDTAENGGAEVDANAFADAISLSSAATTSPVHDLYETGSAVGVEKIAMPIWQQLGLSSDPNKFYDLCYTGATPGSGAGTLSVRVQVVKPGA
jgi:hypothetical protein